MRRRVLRVLLLALVLGGAALCLTCSPGYVLRAGWQEAKILSRRRPIAEAVSDPGTPAETRRKLSVVLQAREFAQRRLGLNAGESFTTYSWVERDTLLMVLSAAYADRFVPYTWWFPIVGRVPYKGFFDFDRAYREADKLARAGYDTYVRPSGAFSTLGWFNDPVLNTVLRYSDVYLANTVIHELLHNTIYVAGQAGFNESYANFVGDRGAIVFFCQRDGESASTCQQARAEWADNLVFGAFLSDLVHRLEALYDRADLDRAAKLAAKTGLLEDARKRFGLEVRPRLRTGAYRNFEEAPLNNAVLIGIRLYYEQLDLFEQLFEQYGQDLPATIRAITAAARSASDDPFTAVSALVTP